MEVEERNTKEEQENGAEKKELRNVEEEGKLKGVVKEEDN